jgi:anthranilate/para-aminobenzoate synthase component II
MILLIDSYDSFTFNLGARPFSLSITFVSVGLHNRHFYGGRKISWHRAYDRQEISLSLRSG